MALRKLISLCTATALFLSACSNSGCEGPALDVSKLSVLRTRGLQSTSGPEGFLIVPNPIDATNSATASVADSKIIDAGGIFSLMGLTAPTRLDNAFLKVRIKDISDALSTLAAPNSSGDFNFKPDNIHYSEVMAYRSVTAIQAYVEALGFAVVKTRPLYVMVQAAGSTNRDVNAFYDHAYLNPKSPRTIKLYGASQFAPGADQDMYWHEFGHLFNESVSGERGIDYAGDTGAVWTEGSAIHECLADYLSESVSDKPYIGKWIARNLDGYKAGDPLRSAQGPMDFRTVATADGTGARPERYEVAEWCTRVLWDIRKNFIAEDAEAGALKSDRMIYSAVSLLKRDTSFSQFQSALQSADEELHCGGHSDAITEAFENRGFVEAESLSGPLKLTAAPVTVKVSDTGSVSAASAAPGVTVLFNVRIQNGNSEVARNVRLKLEPRDAKLIALTYQQGYGDIPAGKTISIGTGGAGLGPDFSVVGEIDSTARAGQRIPYRLRLIPENGTETVFDGELRL